MAFELDPINSGYSQAKINQNFQAIEDEFNNRTLRRTSEVDETNQMEENLDLNSNDILNVSNISADTMTLGGQEFDLDSVEGVLPPQVGQAGKFLQTDGAASSWEIPTASEIANVPAGGISSINVQDAVNELDTEKLTASSNLSDVGNAATARANLDVPQTSSVVAVSDIGTTVQAFDADIPTEIVSQVDAEAGTATDPRTWTAERVSQAISAQAVFTKEFTTPGAAIVAGGLISVAHGFGEKPKLVRLFAICTTADVGYSIGDEVELDLVSSSTATNKASSIYVDSTNLNLRISNVASNSFNIANKSTGALVGIDNNDWEVYMRAWV